MARNDKEEFNYREDLEINEHALEKELLRQPLLFSKYSDLLAEAEKRVKKCEEQEKVLRSQLILQAANGEIKELGKATAQTIEAWFRDHPDHKEAKRNLIQAEYERDILQGVVSSFRIRTNMLENMVKLYLSNYYTTNVSAPSEYVEKANENLSKDAADKAAKLRDRRS